MTARIRVLCRDQNGTLTLSADQPLEPDQPMVLGREGDIGVGISPVDPKVSRQAVHITRTDAGWRVVVTNRNGVIVHPWAQPPGMAEPESVFSWPRLALRVVGRPQLQHWVLLDDPALQPRRPVPLPGTELTESVEQPRPLTVPQELAVRALFAELLAWPPLVPATPRQIKQVASRLGVRTESIQRRLEEVRKKAGMVGLSRTSLLTDPEYLYVLVRAGYLAPDEDDLHPLLTTAAAV
jgi:hypothetical protein